MRGFELDSIYKSNRYGNIGHNAPNTNMVKNKNKIVEPIKPFLHPWTVSTFSHQTEVFPPPSRIPRQTAARSRDPSSSTQMFQTHNSFISVYLGGYLKKYEPALRKDHSLPSSNGISQQLDIISKLSLFTCFTVMISHMQNL